MIDKQNEFRKERLVVEGVVEMRNNDIAATELSDHTKQDIFRWISEDRPRSLIKNKFLITDAQFSDLLTEYIGEIKDIASQKDGIEKLVAMEMMRLSGLSQRSYDAFAESKIEEIIEVVEGDRGHATKTVTKKTAGNPAFLRIAADVIKMRIEMFGLKNRSDHMTETEDVSDIMAQVDQLLEALPEPEESETDA